MEWSKRNDLTQDRRTKAADSNQLIVERGCAILKSTFKNDATRIWNTAPDQIESSTSLWSVKKNIKAYVLTLPI